MIEHTIKSLVAAIILATCWPGGSALAADAVRAPFGELADGRVVESVTLSNDNGVSARVITLGATLQSLQSPDSSDAVDEITLGYDTAAEYLANPQYFGATIGRFANRIAQGRFTLAGNQIELATNDGPNHLHGGTLGFDKRLWSIVSVRSGKEAAVSLKYVSADGEEGYPGRLDVIVIYTLSATNELKIDFEARTTAPTIVNLTNHTYFNLAGQRASRSVLDHQLLIPASRFTPVDRTLIPTGELAMVSETPFDFRQSTTIGKRIHAPVEQLRYGRGYDHNWVLDDTGTRMKLAARLEDPVSGRILEVLSTSPAVQFYSGNFLDGTVAGRAGRAYRQSDGLCLEPQVFPDAPNQPKFPSARLDPGETYRNTIVLRLIIQP